MHCYVNFVMGKLLSWVVQPSENCYVAENPKPEQSNYPF